MIVPSSRILWCVAAIPLPASLLVVADPAFAGVSLSVLALTVATAVLDAVLSGARHRGVCVHMDPVVRATSGRPFELTATVSRPGEGSLRLRVAIGISESLDPEADTQAEVRLAVGQPSSGWTKELLAGRRGLHHIRSARTAVSSPLGFWEHRRDHVLSTEVRVYPNLSHDRKLLAALFLNRGLAGVHAQRQLGQGREFEKLREYAAGDSFQDVHWKATARRGHPVTKVYQVERTQEVYVVLDASRLSTRGMASPSGGEEPALDRYIAAALVLGQAAERQGDLFGLAVFSDRVDRFVRAGSGAGHFQACRDALFQLETRAVSPDFEELATFLRTRLRRRALLLYLTSLDDPLIAESFARHVPLVASAHVVQVCLPRVARMDPLFSAPDVRTVDEVYERLGGHLGWHRVQQQITALERQGVGARLADPARLSLALVERYTAIKQQQIL